MTALASPSAAVPTDVSLGQLRDAFGAMTHGGLGPQQVLVSASIRVEALDPLAWFAAARASGEDVAFWLQPGTGRSSVGVGVAVSIDVTGERRFLAAAAAWERWCTTGMCGGPAAGRPAAGPLLVGGATFADLPSTDPCWTGFEQGRLDVPAIQVTTVDGETILTANLVVDGSLDVTDAVEALLDRVHRVMDDALAYVSPVHQESLPLLRRLGSTPDHAEWSASVARSSGAVGRGRIDKVVLARRVDIEAAAPIDVPGVLARLGASPVGAAPVTVFALTRGKRVFLGASPERLVEADRRAFRTIALAGTTGRDPDPATDRRLAEALLASEKDREEHAVVVDMLRETLGPVASALDIERTPHIVRLPTVQHLASDVAGVLGADRSILDLVERLHPTPAVGGWPRAAALELLDEQEHLDRGWYAGPVGWLDARGDGEFVVAIRSGVVEGGLASLFVGCGIVGDSEPDREWAESSMKLDSVASAIGRLDQ